MKKFADFQNMVCLLFLICTCANCGDSSDNGHDARIEECKSNYGTDKGYGFDPQYSNPDEAADWDFQDPQEAQSRCLNNDGHDCSADGFCTTDAAMCIAKVYGLEQGVTDWTVGFLYRSKFNTVVWNIQNTTSSSPNGASEGNQLTINATTGELLENMGVSTIP